MMYLRGWALRPLLAGVLGLAVLIGGSAALASPASESSPPGTVASVSVTRADGSLTASWNAPAGATKYHITYSANSGASWSLAAFGHPSSSITINADNASTYIVGVRAGNDAGWSGWRNSSASGPYTPTPPPATPASVGVTRADGSLTASWGASSGATGYHITYSSNGGGSWSLAAYGHTSTSITISATNSASYIVGVRALNSAGGSGWRNSPSSGPYTPPNPPPGTPSSVTVTRSDGSLTASWDAPSGATSYHVTYSSNGKQSWSLAAFDHSSNSITIDATNSATYYVAVRAKNDAGGSGWRNSSAASPYIPPAPAAPSGLTGAGGLRSVWLEWDDPSNSSITGYEYAVQPDGQEQGDWTSISGSDASTTSHVVSGLTAGTEYTIHLRAVNAGGNSPAAQASGTPVAPAILVQDTSGNAITELSVPEGGEASYQVVLSARPEQDIKVCVGLSVRDNNDPDITFKGEPAGTVAVNLVFTRDNWNTPQVVTLLAAEDVDDANGIRDIDLDTRQTDYPYAPGKVDLAAIESDND